MKKTMRLILLAVTAALAMAVVVPAAASAQGQWLINGEPFEGEVETPYEATLFVARYSNWLGVECIFHGTATMAGGTSQAQIDSVDVPPYEGSDPPEDSICGNPWAGSNAGCLGEPTGEELPWNLHATAATEWNRGWELDSFKLNTNMKYIPNEEVPCGYNNELKVSGSEFTGTFGLSAKPGMLYGYAHGESTSYPSSYTTGGSIEFNFPEVEFGA